MMRPLRILSLLLPVLWTKAWASESILLVGGGDSLTGSEISIERNTQWILGLLQQGQRPIQLLYTDGGAAGPDIYQVVEPQTLAEQLLLILGPGDDLHRYSSSSFSLPAAPATAQQVQQKTTELLKSGQDLFFLYQGHGLAFEGDSSRNFLRLWQQSQFSAQELATLLDRHQQGRFRFLFPQCFSGSFARLIYQNMDPRQGLTPQTRCGFVSQLEFLPSEGCTPSVREQDYRDYASYFFEALSGQGRAGQPLAEHADYNGDHRVSPREAHLYGLRNADSIDHSLASSEYYLLHWHQWFTRWLPAQADPTNSYYQIAARLNQQAGLTDDPLQSRPQRRQRLAALKTDEQAAQRGLDQAIQHYQQQRTTLANQLRQRWPGLANSQGEVDPQQLATVAAEVSSLIEASGLLPLRKEIHTQQQGLTQLQRQIARLLKVERMLDLARSQALFQRLGSKSEQAEYQRLLDCEESPL